MGPYAQIDLETGICEGIIRISAEVDPEKFPNLIPLTEEEYSKRPMYQVHTVEKEFINSEGLPFKMLVDEVTQQYYINGEWVSK